MAAERERHRDDEHVREGAVELGPRAVGRDAPQQRRAGPRREAEQQEQAGERERLGARAQHARPEPRRRGARREQREPELQPRLLGHLDGAAGERGVGKGGEKPEEKGPGACRRG